MSTFCITLLVSPFLSELILDLDSFGLTGTAKFCCSGVAPRCWKRILCMLSFLAGTCFRFGDGYRGGSAAANNFSSTFVFGADF